MSQIWKAPIATPQELRILQFYVNGLKKETRFDCLDKNGFIGILEKCAATSTFDKFLADIDHEAKKQKYLGKYNFFQIIGISIDFDQRIRLFFILKGIEEQKAIEELKREWHEEIEIIRKCIDCYEHWTTAKENQDYFTLLCAKPHLLVFVPEPENEGPRMWPAKVLSVHHNGTVTIECFGDYLSADYKFEDCFLYSKTQEQKYKKMIAVCAKNRKIIKKREYRRSFLVSQNEIKRQFTG